MRAALVKTSQGEEDPGPSLDPLSPYPLRWPLGETQWSLWVPSDTTELENYSGYIVLFHLEGKIHAPFKWNYHFPLHICKMQKETTGGYKGCYCTLQEVLTILKGQPSSPFCKWDQMNSKESFKSHIRPYHPSTLDCPRLPSHFHPLPSAQRPAPSTCPCLLFPDTLVFLLFLQPARSAPSLGPPASDPPTPGDCIAPTFMPLRPREAPAL